MIRFQEMANALRVLSVDMVEAACSGHPGMPLGMADIATVLWRDFLKHHPKNPHWFNRDRFVLSNGHGSALLYALLYLAGYNLSLEDLKSFRKLHSKTPGHPEYRETPGVETTTGPLAQGLGAAVGMAIAEKILSTRFNKRDITLVDHFTYVFVGDGCLMEGLSHEVCSLAGTLRLGKLIVFYDDNGISIDGKVTAWFTDDTQKRFSAYHWHVIGPIDGHCETDIHAAILEAQKEQDRPSLILCKTVIGFGSNLAGSEKSHGAPLGHDGVLSLRQSLNWLSPPFVIPENIQKAWDQIEKGAETEEAWHQTLAMYKKKYVASYETFLRVINGDLPDDFYEVSEAFLLRCRASAEAAATRKHSKFCLDFFIGLLPEILGGSADLSESNGTVSSLSASISTKNFSGNYLHYGVREFGMAAMMNGLALHGGLIPYGGTFLVFSDYAKNAIRLSALMKQRVIYILTHDSIGLGEDGPTHQPIEQAAMLRMTPNVAVWRPADLLETAVAWEVALSHRMGPSALLLSRQSLPALSHEKTDISHIRKGGYILYESDCSPELILIATGSEVSLALSVAKALAVEGCRVRVVSMPCAELFLSQNQAYQAAILPVVVRQRIAIEAASPDYWYRFTGLDGLVFGIHRFGLSGPANAVFDEEGLTHEKVLSKIKVYLNH